VKALLLSAGFGTRLKPITDKIPKCLVPIAGKPLLDYWLENLSMSGINDILVNTHYKHNQVNDFIKNSKYSNIVKTVYEKDLLGTAGTILKNIDFFENDDGIIIHADNICEDSIFNIIKCFKNRSAKSVLTMLSFRTMNPKACGIIEVNSNGIVVSYEEKPMLARTNLANGAVFIVSDKFQREIRKLKINGNDFCKNILPQFVNRMNVYETSKFFVDIGTLENYTRADLFFKSKLFNGE
jgi:mannose-1-phosphate guanylyltransferase